jgi:hypothetical protein
MTTEADPAISAEAGITSAITCLAIDEARRTGTVVDLEPYWQRLADAGHVQRQGGRTDTGTTV